MADVQQASNLKGAMALYGPRPPLPFERFQFNFDAGHVILTRSMALLLEGGNMPRRPTTLGPHGSLALKLVSACSSRTCLRLLGIMTWRSMRKASVRTCHCSALVRMRGSQHFTAGDGAARIVEYFSHASVMARVSQTFCRVKRRLTPSKCEIIDATSASIACS